MKWAVDAMLGDLARYLLILGEDVFYRSDCFGDTLVRIAQNEDRIILSRNTQLSQHSDLHILYIPQNMSLFQKLIFVKKHFALRFSPENLFSRCLLCNREIIPLQRSDSSMMGIPERVTHEFLLYTCPQCNKIYWKGGHFERTKHTLIEHGIFD